MTQPIYRYDTLTDYPVVWQIVHCRLQINFCYREAINETITADNIYGNKEDECKVGKIENWQFGFFFFGGGGISDHYVDSQLVWTGSVAGRGPDHLSECPLSVG